MPSRLEALTQPQWLSDHWEVLVIRPVRILMIVLIALVIRALINRAISKLTSAAEADSTPGVLRPLRERASTLLEGAVLSERRRQRAETIGSILRSITSFAVFGLAFVLILGELRINLAPIIASAGIAGFAFGFGAQNLVKDFLSGMFMILEDQYGVGDIIDAGEATGTVEAVSLRTTRLRDVQGTVWYVRNGEIVRIGNKSQGYAQVVLDVPLPHTADVEQAAELIKETAAEVWADEDWADSVLDEPNYLGMEQITADGVVLRLTGRVKPGDQFKVGRELRSRLKERLDKAGFSAAYTTGQIYVRTDHPGADPD